MCFNPLGFGIGDSGTDAEGFPTLNKSTASKKSMSRKQQLSYSSIYSLQSAVSRGEVNLHTKLLFRQALLELGGFRYCGRWVKLRARDASHRARLPLDKPGERRMLEIAAASSAGRRSPESVSLCTTYPNLPGTDYIGY